MRTHGPAFDGRNATCLERESFVAGRSERHGAREQSCATHPEAHARFEVARHEQRHGRLALQSIQHGGG